MGGPLQMRHMSGQAKATRPVGRRSVRRLSLLLALPLCIQGQGVRGRNSEATAGLPILTRVEQIRRLTPEQAARGYPVHIQAVVTYFSPARPDPAAQGEYFEADLFVQDRTAGIWVNAPRTGPALRAGQVVDLEGVTEAPDFAPQIGRPHYEVVGEGPLPTPRRVSLERMLSTAEDGQWVEIDGIVRRAEIDGRQLLLDVAVPGGRLQALIPEFRQSSAGGLVDAEVRIRGACGALFNQNLQLVGIVLNVPDLAQLKVLRAAPPDPYGVAVEPIATLQRFAPQRAMGHRVHVQGIVTLQDGARTVYIGDGKHGIRIDSARPVDFKPGDQLDVAGFPRVSGFVLEVEDAISRRIGTAAPPVPLPVTAEQILRGDYDSHLVSIEGRLLEESFSAGTPVMVLKNGATVFDASLRRADHARKPILPRTGAIVRLNGICLVTKDESQHNQSFQIILDSARDMLVTHNPSWWTAGRALVALELSALVVLAVLVWVVSLRRQVRGQIAVIRQRLEREAALEQRFHNLLDNTHDVIFTVDLRGMLTSLNKAGEQISGYTQEEVQETPLAAVFSAESQEVSEALRCVARGEPYGARDWAIAGKKGQRTRVEVSLQAVKEGGKPVGILGIARDISDRKRMEQVALRAQELSGARDAAEEANRAKSAFLANMSHEIRTPLNAIIGYSQMLQEDYIGPAQEEVRSDLQKIERAGHLLLGIVNDILDLSKIEAGRNPVELQNVDVAAVLQDVYNAVQPLARQQGNVVRIDCPEHARLAYADLPKFRQSVLNLVNNACKFTQNGQVSVAVRKLRNGSGEWTEVSVSDTGIGIGAEHLGKLFQPFSQVDGSVNRKHNGTGLGLALSKKFCQMMGGDITVASEPGRGSRFSIRLPAPASGASGVEARV